MPSSWFTIGSMFLNKLKPKEVHLIIVINQFDLNRLSIVSKIYENEFDFGEKQATTDILENLPVSLNVAHSLYFLKLLKIVAH